VDPEVAEAKKQKEKKIEALKEEKTKLNVELSANTVRVNYDEIV
jgi:hypothetical protein